MYERDRKRKLCLILFLLHSNFFRLCSLFDFFNQIIGRTQIQTSRTPHNIITTTSPLSLLSANKSLICYVIQRHCVPLLSIHAVAHHTNKAFLLLASLAATLHSFMSPQSVNAFFNFTGADVQGGFFPPSHSLKTKTN